MYVDRDNELDLVVTNHKDDTKEVLDETQDRRRSYCIQPDRLRNLNWIMATRHRDIECMQTSTEC